MASAKQYHLAKKIAQLTKVIYNLNTLNEDYELEREIRDEQHEAQLDHVTQDARAKLNSAAASLSEAHAALEREKEAAGYCVAELRRAHKRTEERLRSEHAGEIRELTRQYGDGVDQLRELKSEFDDEMRTVKRASEKEKDILERQNQKKLDAMRKAHSDELQSVKEEAGRRADKMSREKQDMIDAAKRERTLHEKALRDEYDRATSALQKDYASRIERDETSHNAEISRLESELSQAHSVNESLSTRLQEASTCIAQKESELESVQLALSQERQNLDTIKEMHAASEEREARAQHEISQGEEALSVAKEKEVGFIAEISGFKKELAEAELRERCLRSENSQRTAEIAALALQASEREKEMASLQNDLSGKIFALKELESRHKALQENARAMKQQHDQRNAAAEEQLAHLDEAAKAQQLQTTVACRKLLALITKLQNERQSVGAFVQTTFSAIQSDAAETRKVICVEEERRSRERAHVLHEETKRVEQVWTKKLAFLKSAKNAAIKTLEDELNLRTSHAKKEQQELSEKNLRISEEKNDLAQKVDNCKRELGAKDDLLLTSSKTCDDLRTMLDHREKDITGLRQRCKELNLRMSESKSQHDGIVAALKAKVTESEARTSKALTSLSGAKNELESTVQQFHDFRQEVLDFHRQAKDLVTKVVRTCVLDERAARENHLRETKQLQMTIADQVKKFDEHEAFQRKAALAHEERIHEIQARNADLVARLESEKKGAEDLWMERIKEMKAEHTSFVQRIKQDLVNEHNEEMHVAEDRAAAKLDLLRNELESVKRAGEEKAKSTLQSMEEDFDQKIELIRRELIDVHEADLLAERERGANEMRKIEAVHNTSMRQLRHELQCAHKESDQKQKEFDDVSRKLFAVEQNLEESSKRIVGLESKLCERGQEVEELRERIVTMGRHWEDEQEAMQTHSKEQLNKTVESANIEKATIRMDLEAQLEHAYQELNAARDRWNNREGRPEDLERICSLEQSVKDWSLKEKKAREEMMYFKRELLNREENFNQKFIGESRGDVLTTKNNVHIQETPLHTKGSKQRRRRHTAFPQLSNG